MGFMPQPILQTCWAKAAAYSPLQKSPPIFIMSVLANRKANINTAQCGNTVLLPSRKI